MYVSEARSARFVVLWGKKISKKIAGVSEAKEAAPHVGRPTCMAWERANEYALWQQLPETSNRRMNKFDFYYRKTSKNKTKENVRTNEDLQ